MLTYYTGTIATRRRLPADLAARSGLAAPSPPILFLLDGGRASVVLRNGCRIGVGDWSNALRKGVRSRATTASPTSKSPQYFWTSPSCSRLSAGNPPLTCCLFSQPMPVWPPALLHRGGQPSYFSLPTQLRIKNTGDSSPRMKTSALKDRAGTSVCTAREMSVWLFPVFASPSPKKPQDPMRHPTLLAPPPGAQFAPSDWSGGSGRRPWWIRTRSRKAEPRSGLVFAFC